MIKVKKFSGVVVPMVTPLTEAKKIDTRSVEKIVRAFAENQISPLVLGTTGESTSLNAAQSAELVKAAVQCKGTDQHIYAGLVGCQVEEQIERAKRYFDLGCDVVVATLPSYYILTPDQMISYYTALADQVPGPLMMYNIKATTQMSIPLEVVSQLSNHENILGLKDSERDIERLKACIEKYRDNPDFSFFCGWGGEGANSLKWGADGIVPSTGNIVPDLYRQLYAAAIAGDYEMASLFQTQTDEIAKIYQGGRTLGQSLAALKVMMESFKLCKPHMMPPLSELKQEEADKIKALTKDYFKQTHQL